ncbi:unnamed protein product [Auanema sp. JU1783]|nr:unnamed protein product [Auanema sp. JU1783]
MSTYLIVLTNLVLFLFANGLDSIEFTNPEFPNPYWGPISRNQINYTVPDGYGTIILFRQFLVSSKDCVFICSANNRSECDNLCGDVMDHRSVKKALRVKGSASITVVSTGSSDYCFHSGVFGVIMPYKVTNPGYSTCSGVIDLSVESFYFLVSHNYPENMFQFGPCNVHFQSLKRIRLAIYFLSTSVTLDKPFVVTGISPNGNWNNQSFSGKYVNDGDPFALYYSKNVSISYEFAKANTTVQRGFYILVDEVEDPPVTPASCYNEGDYVLKAGELRWVGTNGYGKINYDSYSDCYFKVTNPFKNHLSLIDLSYESEKCCDTMDFDGVGIAPYSGGTYQGAQYSFWNFAQNSTVSMHFQSDGVINGPGFSAKFYDIDCTCGLMKIQLNDSNPAYTIRQPTLNSPTYCPSLNCAWNVTFPVDYNLQIGFQKLNLRQPTNGQDVLSVMDSFGNIVKQTASSNTDPTSLLSTSALTTISLSTSSDISFIPAQYGSGVIVNMTIVKKDIIHREIKFTDQLMFYDISTNLFKARPSGTYEFLVSARDSTKFVTIYFFYITNQISHVDIFNGDNPDPSLKVNPQFLQNITRTGSPTTYTSTGPVLLIRVQRNTDYKNFGQDFQAMVTDLTSSELKVHNTPTPGKYYEVVSDREFTIFHADDIYYDKQLISSLAYSSDTAEVFKGLTLADSNLLSKYTLPTYIFDRYLVVRNNASSSITYNYYFNILGNIQIPLTANPKLIGTVMTSDYLPYLLPYTNTSQQISIDLTDGEEKGMYIEFLKSSNAGQGVIHAESFGKRISSKSFSGANGTFTMELCCTEIVIQYSAPPGPDNGLYILYKGGNLICKNSSRLSLGNLLVLFFLLII